jgi:formylglycine-generating enzyme required for sulfatase activity
MVPVTLTLPQLQLTAPLGTTNALEVSTNLTAWQDIATLVFSTTNRTWLDLYPRGGAAYYRLRRVAGSGGNNPPFPAPLTNFIWIAPGQFVMGSPSSDPDLGDGEQPQTTVTLTRGFFMGKFEVTQGEYQAVTGNNPSFFTGDPALPVESVTWQNATNYCHLLNTQEAGANRLPSGYTYRLATEAEWEYAARAGSTNRFSWGDDYSFAAIQNHAWFTANSSGGTHLVGQKLPNAWGLYDTAGNVREWVQDSENTYPGGSVTDPVPFTGSNNKMIRGGSHADEAASCRPAMRNAIPQTLSVPIFGLRVVLAQTSP